jgi:hypothetical protein
MRNTVETRLFTLYTILDRHNSYIIAASESHRQRVPEERRPAAIGGKTRLPKLSVVRQRNTY